MLYTLTAYIHAYIDTFYMNIFTCLYFNFEVRRMGRQMVPHVKDHNPLGTQKIVSHSFE
jgi:hypothetical protein